MNNDKVLAQFQQTIEATLSAIRDASPHTPASWDNTKSLYSLYLVTDRTVLGERDFLGSIEAAIQGGVTIVQLREKAATSQEFFKLALQVKALTDKYNIPLIINDRVDIALAIDAAGVHVGQQDIPAKVVRKLLGSGKILGVSAATIEEAKQAVKDGADYLGVGAIFATNTKSNTRCTPISLLTEIKHTVHVPVVAIGGINESNIHQLHGTGIDGIAVVSAILGATDVKDAAASLLANVAQFTDHLRDSHNNP